MSNIGAGFIFSIGSISYIFIIISYRCESPLKMIKRYLMKMQLFIKNKDMSLTLKREKDIK
jgi:hypothetical protein